LQSVKAASAPSVASVPVAANTLSVNQTPLSSGHAKDASAEVIFHRLVLLLGKRDASLPPVPWDDLLTLLTPKHPGLSKTQLIHIVISHKTIFSAFSAGVVPCPLGHDLVLKYFDLSESVEKTYTASEAMFSLISSCSVKVSKTVAVSGIVCMAEKKGDGNVLHFQFGNNVIYKLKNMAKGGCKHGQMFSSVLRLR
jgi:hypothetical protein